MSTSRIVQWSGVLTIIVGVLLFFFGFSPLIFMPISEPILQWVLDDQWFALSLMAFVLTLMTPLALVGLYACQVQESGRLGFLGFLLFGIATVRAGVLPRWAALLLIVGVPFVGLGGLLLPQVVRAVGAILAAAGLVWMGYALWKQFPPERAARPNTRQSES